MQVYEFIILYFLTSFCVHSLEANLDKYLLFLATATLISNHFVLGKCFTLSSWSFQDISTYITNVLSFCRNWLPLWFETFLNSDFIIFSTYEPNYLLHTRIKDFCIMYWNCLYKKRKLLKWISHLPKNIVYHFQYFFYFSKFLITLLMYWKYIVERWKEDWNRFEAKISSMGKDWYDY